MNLKPIADIPEYKKAFDALQGLYAQRAKLAGELDKLEAARQVTSDIEFKAIALLDGVDVASQRQAPAADDLARAHDALRVVEKAVELQAKRLQGVVTRLACDVTAELMPRYRAIVTEQARLAVEFATAFQKESAFLDIVNEKGYPFAGGSRFGMRAFSFERSGRLEYQLTDLIERGLLDPKEPFLQVKELAELRPIFERAAAAVKASTPAGKKGPMARLTDFITNRANEAA